MNTRQKGTQKEKKACDYLEKKGFRIVQTNYRTRQGEIDIVGYQGEVLVFVEVKYRRTDHFGTASQAVDYKKQGQICRIADFYRFTHKIDTQTPVRYDVVAIQGEEVQWIRNAFPHIVRYE